MDRNYVIKVEPGEGCSEEFVPERKIRDGLACSGYVLIGFDQDGDPKFDTIYGVNVMGIAQMLAFSRSQTADVIWQAAAIAEGLQKAEKIRKERKGTIIGSAGFDPKKMDETLREALLRGILGQKDE